MKPLTRDELYSLERYAELRPEFRVRLIEHRAHRRVLLGERVRLHFEDRLTVQYQILEMLRAEQIQAPEAIQAELDAYNPLIPDGDNWKATLMIESAGGAEAGKTASDLAGLEQCVWIRIGGRDVVRAVPDEDLEFGRAIPRERVHFLRFQLSPAIVHAALDGSTIGLGIDHSAYNARAELPNATRAALLAVLDQKPGDSVGPPRDAD